MLSVITVIIRDELRIPDIEEKEMNAKDTPMLSSFMHREKTL